MGSEKAFSNQVAWRFGNLSALDYLVSACPMSIQRLQSVAINKANLVRSNANDRSIFPVDLEYVIVPAAIELSAIYPKLAEGCEKRSWNAAVGMKKDVVSYLGHVERYEDPKENTWVCNNRVPYVKGNGRHRTEYVARGHERDGRVRGVDTTRRERRVNEKGQPRTA